MSSPRPAALLALPAALVASVWLIGDLSYSGPVDGGLDVAFRPVGLPGGVVAGLGIGGLAVLALTARPALRRRGTRAGWLLLAAAGALLGLTYRTATAGVIGANIGAGLALMFLVPLAVVLAGLAGWALLAGQRRDRRPGQEVPRRAPRRLL